MGDLDSANSGSMQSSSSGGGGGGGDDQEYDSRNGGESISALLNPMTSSFNNLSPPPLPLQLYYNNSLMSTNNNNGSSSFDAHHNQLSNYFDHPPTNTLSQSSSFPASPTFLLNHNHNNHNHNNCNQLDMVWPDRLRPSISTDVDANYTMAIPNHHQHGSPLPSPPAAVTSSSAPAPTGSGRNPKKRSRASRRAPTTVLTTDTNNFRQMVQEFTGVPAPPFTPFSPRARFDLFHGLGLGSGSGPGPSTSASSLPTPPYLLRPLPQKIPPVHQPPFLANISSSSSAAAAATNHNTAMSMTTSATSTNFNHVCDQHLINNTNPHLTSLLSQSQPTSSAAVLVNGALPNIRGVSKGEGMTMDSWICCSSSE